MNKQSERRTFLRMTTGAVVAGSTLVNQSARASQKDEETVVVGVMGLSRGQDLARTFSRQPNCIVKYVCDVDATRVAALQRRLQQEHSVETEGINDFRRILDDPDVDALVCAAPNHWHAPATILACQTGKHVYVEKPCSHNPAEGEMMVEAARRHKRAVQMGTQRRSSSGTRQAMESLHNGVIGRVYLARCWYNNTRGSIGQADPSTPPDYINYELWQGPAPHRPFKSNVVHYNWHWFWHWGNGELGNNGVHAIDLCRWGLNVTYPTRVASSGGRYCFDDDQQTPDTHTVCFEFPGEKAISWQGLSCNRHGGRWVTFYGTDGTLDLDSNGNHRIYNLRDEVQHEHRQSELGDGQHAANFLQAIRQQDPSSLNAEIHEGHLSTLLCHLGNISHRVGRSIVTDPLSGRVQNDSEAAALWNREYADGWEPRI